MLLKCKYSPNRKNFALNFPSPSTPTASTRRRMRFLASDLRRERERGRRISDDNKKTKILSCGGDDVDDGESVRLYDEEDLPLSLSLLLTFLINGPRGLCLSPRLAA